MTLLDKELQRSILGLQVKCSSGCPWVGELRQHERHVSLTCDGDCPLVEVSCTHGCGQVMMRSLLRQHEEETCIKRPVEFQLARLQSRMERMCSDITQAYKAEIEELRIRLHVQTEEMQTIKEELNDLKKDHDQFVASIPSVYSSSVHSDGASLPVEKSKINQSPALTSAGGKKFLNSNIFGNKGDNNGMIVLPGGRTVTVKKGDMIKESADVIVNAADSHLQHSGGLAGALDTASNGELQKLCDLYCMSLGPVPTGKAVVTAAGGKLKCKHVIHAVGPRAYECKDNAQCQKFIFDAITNSLEQACKLKAESIVFPALSTGLYAVKPDISAHAMFHAITSFSYKNAKCLKDIRIVLFDKPTYACFANELPRWRPNSKGATATPPGFE